MYFLIKLCGYPTSEKLDLYELKMALFDFSKHEDFFFVTWTWLSEASGTLGICAKVQYVCTLLRVGALHQFDGLYSEVEGANPITLKSIILCLGM